MTQISYEDAVDTARKFFLSISQRSETSFSPREAHEDGSLKANTLQILGVRRILDDPQKIICEARRDADSFDALRFGAAQLLAIGKVMPAEIYTWVAQYLLGKIERPTAAPGSKGKSGLHVRITFVVNQLVAKGMKATRNDASEPCSACDAVAAALRDLKMKPNSYKRVEVIYRKLSKARRDNGAIVFDKDGNLQN